MDLCPCHGRDWSQQQSWESLGKSIPELQFRLEGTFKGATMGFCSGPEFSFWGMVPTNREGKGWQWELMESGC